MVPSRTTRESRHTLSTTMLRFSHHTRLVDTLRLECSDLEADAAVAAVVAHVADGHRPLGHHAAQSTAPSALKAAQRKPIHPSALAAPCRNRCH